MALEVVRDFSAHKSLAIASVYEATEYDKPMPHNWLRVISAH
jgi:hypothetical protein